jgi:hypothetical protein
MFPPRQPTIRTRDCHGYPTEILHFLIFQPNLSPDLLSLLSTTCAISLTPSFPFTATTPSKDFPFRPSQRLFQTHKTLPGKPPDSLYSILIPRQSLLLITLLAHLHPMTRHALTLTHLLIRMPTSKQKVTHAAITNCSQRSPFFTNLSDPPNILILLQSSLMSATGTRAYKENVILNTTIVLRRGECTLGKSSTLICTRLHDHV